MSGGLPSAPSSQGRDGGNRIVQFSNKISSAEKLTIEWFMEHSAICCICTRVLDTYDVGNFKQHPRLKVVVCSPCFSALEPDDLFDVQNCMWCGNDSSKRPADAEAPSFTVCCFTDCSNRLCDGCLCSNFTKTQTERMRIAWNCFECDSRSIAPHQLYAESLTRFARKFRQPVIADQGRVLACWDTARTAFLNNVRALLAQLEQESIGAKLSAEDLEEHIELATKLRAELGALRTNPLEPEPRMRSTGAEPGSETPNAAVSRMGEDSSSVKVESRSPDSLEVEAAVQPPDPNDEEQTSALRVGVKAEIGTTHPLSRGSCEESSSDSNDTLILDLEVAGASSGAAADNDELDRLFGDIYRRTFATDNEQHSSESFELVEGEQGDITNFATQGSVPPLRMEKVYEEPFLSSDEEIGSSKTRGDSASPPDGAPLSALSSDYVVFDDGNSTSDDDVACLNSPEPSQTETSSDESSWWKSRRSRDRAGGEAGSGAGRVSARRRTVPPMPQIATSPGAAKRMTCNKSEGRSRLKNRIKRKYSSDESSTDHPLSDLESEGGDDMPWSGKADSSDRTTSTPAKRLRPVKLVSEESESDHGSLGDRNEPTSADIEETPSKVEKSPGPSLEEETFIISSDDEEFIAPVTETIVKTEACTPRGRKNIREMMSRAQLSRATIQATVRERERRKRLDEMRRKCIQYEMSIEQAEGEDVRCILEFDPVTKEALVQVDPQLSKRMKAHQLEGVKFMYQNLVESIAELRDDSPGTGAILGHCMGLGKTFQVVCFLHTLMTHPSLKEHFRTVLIISPLNVISAWQEEISRWVERDPKVPEKLTQYSLHGETCQASRLQTLSEWNDSGGIMLMTLNLLVSLLGCETHAGKQRKRAEQAAHSAGTQQFRTFLCDPGPQVLIVDEGHILKRSSSQLTQIVDKMIRTKRKILLTGTPLQNNLTEYYTMVSIVSPHLLGTKVEYRNRFENPIMNGQYKNSTQTDIRKMRQRASVLNKLLENVVHRRDLSVLQSILPPRHDFVITIRLSSLQETLYEKFLESLASERDNSGAVTENRLLHDFVSLRSVWTHPKLLTMPRNKKKPIVNVCHSLALDPIAQTAAVTREHNSDWFKPLIANENIDDKTLGPKIFILSHLIEQCGFTGDKLVVFCAQLGALDFIEVLLGHMSENDGAGGTWKATEDYFRMDGKTSAEDRHRFFKLFNDPSNTRARLFLVSKNAGKLGSTLVGANRMVLLDTSWNPADDNQAVYRIYRIGQSKPVFIYRFVAFGTMEAKIYARNILKESTSCRVLDDSNQERHFTHEEVRDLYTFTPYDESKRKTPSVPKDEMLAELILEHQNLIADVHEHQQMLQNLEDDLSEEDRRIAWDEYQREKEEPAALPGPTLTNVPSILGISPDISCIHYRRQIDMFTASWQRVDLSDADRLSFASRFRDAVLRYREFLQDARKKALALMSDAEKRGHLKGRISATAERELAIFDAKDAQLSDAINTIDQLIQRKRHSPTDENAHRPGPVE